MAREWIDITTLVVTMLGSYQILSIDHPVAVVQCCSRRLEEMKSPERDFDRVFFRGHDKTAEVFITISIYGLPQQLPLHPLHPLQPLTILESVDGHLDNKKSMGGEVKFALLTFYYDHHATMAAVDVCFVWAGPGGLQIRKELQ